MSPKQFNDACLELFGSVYAAAEPLGLSLRQAQRYTVSEPNQRTIILIGALRLNVKSLKDQRRMLKRDLAFFTERGGRIGTNNVDETDSWIGVLKERLLDTERLLQKHPAGLIPQI